MIKQNCFLLLVFHLLFSGCGNVEKSSDTSSENVFAIDSVKPVKIIDNSVEENRTSIQEQKSFQHVVSKTSGVNDSLSNTKLDIRIFRNTEMSGFGYDIILENGKTYVHQPNIPALPGNNGFPNEESARRVAELVVNKIRNNIMPPTVDVKELDSLGIK